MLLPEELCCCCCRKTATACVWMFAVSCCAWRLLPAPLSVLPVKSWFEWVLGICTGTGRSPSSGGTGSMS